MASSTKIEWTEATWNPITGCSPASAGCLNCYAKRMAARLAGRCGYPRDEPFRVTFHRDRLDEPQHWRKPRRVFVCSMGDLWHPDVRPEDRAAVIRATNLAPQHTYIFLTKRPEFLDVDFSGCPNFWLGVTAEDQWNAEQRIPYLLKCPAVVRFVSCEPLLGPLDLVRWLYSDDDRAKMDNQYLGPFDTAKINWVIAGGETGPKARLAELEWFRSLRDQCEDTPFFFKGTGTAGRKTGSLLDGREWKEYPRNP